MALDINRIRQRQAETSRREGSFYKPKEGKNIIRIFKFSHKVTAEDVRAGYFAKTQLGKIVEELDRPVVRHFNVNPKGGPVISNDRLMDLYHRTKKSDPEKAKSIGPSTSYFINVLDVNNEKNGVVLYGCPTSVYNKILAFMDPEVQGEEVLGASGRDFVLIYDKAKQGTEKYTVNLRKEGLSEELPESVTKGVLDLYTEAAFSQMGEQENGGINKEVVEETEDQEEKLLPAKRRHIDGDMDVALTPPVKSQLTDNDLEDEVEEIFGEKKKPKPADDEEIELESAPPVRKKR